jgi:hypothetical protein
MQPENIIPGMEVHSLRLIKPAFSAKFNRQYRLNLTISDDFNIKSPINHLIIPVCRLTFS